MSILQTDVGAITKSRSIGVKLFLVCVVALLMAIPASFVQSVVQERKERAKDVVQEISEHVGGQQTFLGPVLAIPYTIAATEKEAQRRGVYLVFPSQASATVQTKTEERRRSLFKVPVFSAELRMNGSFDLTGVPASAPREAVLDWSKAEIVVGVSDTRGAQSDATLSVNGNTGLMIPAQTMDGFVAGEHQRMTMLGASVGSIAQPNAKLNVSSALRFSGAQRIAVLAYGKSTQVDIKGDWPSPGFDGGFLPVSRDVSSSGFTASWSVPFIARGVRAEGSLETISGLDATSLGTTFIEVADPYQSVDRSLKYVPLFLGLVFLSYFTFEVTTGRSVHPAQYVLVGIAQLIFYLLLLSFAERVGFDFGFLVAGSATVLLLAFNAAWIFESGLQGVRGFGVFGLLYALIYLLLRLEDNALLVGALASFSAVAAVMYFTRRIDWYGSFGNGRAAQPRVARESELR